MAIYPTKTEINLNKYLRKCICCHREIKIKFDSTSRKRLLKKYRYFSNEAVLFLGGNISCWICNKCLKDLEIFKVNIDDIGY